VRAPFHRVTVGGDVARYSAILFALPGSKIQAPEELVDEELPPYFKPHCNDDSMRFCIAQAPVERRARIRWPPSPLSAREDPALPASTLAAVAGTCPARWRLGAVEDQRGRGPVRWAPTVVASRRAPPCVNFFLFFVCRASQLGRTTKNVQRRLQDVSQGRRQLAFLCRAPPVAHDKDS
jgi:hypothetical protein